jgi:hypothetical protein
MADPRTFKVDSPLMHGDDVKSWQQEMKDEFNKIGIVCPIDVDGYYGVETRSYMASLCHALGMNAVEVMAPGVTPELRTRIRHRTLTQAEHTRMYSKEYIDYRRALRKRWTVSHEVHTPVAKVLQHSWGYHPPVHDGVDVICLPSAPIYAMVKSKVVDVRASGWWGKGAPSDPALKARGDGIIQLEILDSVGPFTPGHHLCYGHAEGAVVHVGQTVNAGAHLGHAGFANAWHVHLMHNDGTVGNRGIGNLNPEPLLNYTLEHG